MRLPARLPDSEIGFARAPAVPAARQVHPVLVFALILLALLIGMPQAARAQETEKAVVKVAVAANFAAPMKRIALAFEQASGHRTSLAIGATGQLHAQIVNGAPFDVLLAADTRTPERLEREGLAVAGSRRTYATGRLALWSAQPGRVDAQGQVLAQGAFQRLAVAHPKLSPYGQASLEVLQRLGLKDRLAPRLVEGASIAQAHQFVTSGNAELGFVALSQVMEGGRPKSGSVWVVPAALHEPIRQDAVLLNKGRQNPAARALVDFLQTETARALIREHGHES